MTVVVPALNEERFLGEQLAALARQTYAGAWEVVVVDNGSTDRTVEVARACADRLPALRIVDASARRGLAYAKNVAMRAARGDVIACCDADDVVTPEWLDALVSAARSADVVGGWFDVAALNDGLTRAWRPQENVARLLVGHGFLPYAAGGNCAVWASVARELGWDEAFLYGADDQDFSWRAQLASYRVAFAADAVVQLRFRRTLPELMRQWYGYGWSTVLLYRRHRRLGMQRDVRTALETWRWLLRRWRDLFDSPGRRGNWLRVASVRVGRLAGSVRFRAFFP